MLLRAVAAHLKAISAAHRTHIDWRHVVRILLHDPAQAGRQHDLAAQAHLHRSKRMLAHACPAHSESSISAPVNDSRVAAKCDVGADAQRVDLVAAQCQRGVVHEEVWP